MSESMIKLLKLVPRRCRYKVHALHEAYGDFMTPLSVLWYKCGFICLIVEILYAFLTIWLEYVSGGNWIYAVLLAIITLLIDYAIMWWAFDPHERTAIIIWFALDCASSLFSFEWCSAGISLALLICFALSGVVKRSLSKREYRVLMQRYKADRRRYYKYNGVSLWKM